MSEIIDFINYINSYLDDDYREVIDFVGSKVYFTSGGCYEMAKIIKHFIPSARIYHTIPNPKKDHVIVRISDEYYDTTGLLPKETIESEYYEVDEEELTVLNSKLGIREVKIEGKSVSEFIISETQIVINESKGKSIDKLLTEINTKLLETVPSMDNEQTLSYRKDID